MARANLTPKDYEDYVAGVISQLDDFRNATMYRNHLFDGIRQPGKYEIDIALKISLVDSLHFFIIIECKKWSRPVDRPAVQKLAQTRDAIAAHKAVITSPVGFTNEAIDVAKAHGIAVWVVAEAKFEVAHAAPPPNNAGSWHPEIDLYYILRETFVRTLLPLKKTSLSEECSEPKSPVVLADLSSLEEDSPNFSNWLSQDIEHGHFSLQCFSGTMYPPGSGARGVDAVTAEYALVQWLWELLKDRTEQAYGTLHSELSQWRTSAETKLLDFGVPRSNLRGAVLAVENGDLQIFHQQLKT